MKNRTRYLLSALATKFGVAGLYSGLSVSSDTLQMQSPNHAANALVGANARGESAAKMVRGAGRWRGRTGDYIELAFEEEISLNTAVFRECSSHSRRFSLKKPGMVHGREVWETFYESDKIEHLRYCAFPMQTLKKLRLCFEHTLGAVCLTEFSLYNEPPKQTEEPFRVSAYLSMKPEDLLAMTAEEKQALGRYFDVINEVMVFSTFGWAKDGRLYYDRTPDVEGVDTEGSLWLRGLEVIKEAIGSRDVRIIPTCWNPGKDTTASLQLHMDEIVDGVTKVILEQDFYGVDFDWEFPKGKKEWLLYGEFIIRLKRKLAPHGKKISVCFADWGVKLPKEAVDAIDTMSYMAYDIIDFNGYHSSFGRAAVRAVKYGMRRGFTKQQLNLGLPFYARPTYSGEYWPVWKDEQSLSYWENYNPRITFEGLEMDAYYNSPGMVADKTAYALQMGLGGVMLFSITCDKPVGHPLCLTDAVGRTLRERTV